MVRSAWAIAVVTGQAKRGVGELVVILYQPTGKARLPTPVRSAGTNPAMTLIGVVQALRTIAMSDMSPTLPACPAVVVPPYYAADLSTPWVCRSVFAGRALLGVRAPIRQRHEPPSLPGFLPERLRRPKNNQTNGLYVPMHLPVMRLGDSSSLSGRN